MFFQLFLTELD